MNVKTQQLHHEDSLLTAIQHEGTSWNGRRFQQTEEQKLNPKQVKILNEAVHGLKAYTPEEQEQLTQMEKSLIKVRLQRNQRLINRWKQELTNVKVDSLLEKLFPKSKLIKDMKNNYTTGNLLNTLSFKDLNISQKMLIDKLIEWKSIPSNFYQL